MSNSKRVVLAYGEVTGHAHAFYGEDTVELQGNKLVVKASDSLKHEEHASHVVNPGIGEVTIQREYQMGSLKRVTD
jgi:hypothetical protein